jgi:hypothetical protein
VRELELLILHSNFVVDRCIFLCITCCSKLWFDCFITCCSKLWLRMCVPFCNMMGVRALRASKLGLGALCNLFWPPPHCFTHTAPSLVSHSTISQGTKRGAERQRRLQPTLAPTPKRSRKRLKSALTSLLVTSQRPLKAGRQPRPSLLPFARGWPRSKPS